MSHDDYNKTRWKIRLKKSGGHKEAVEVTKQNEENRKKPKSTIRNALENEKKTL
jgi:hypothetical protein